MEFPREIPLVLRITTSISERSLQMALLIHPSNHSILTFLNVRLRSMGKSSKYGLNYFRKCIFGIILLKCTVNSICLCFARFIKQVGKKCRPVKKAEVFEPPEMSDFFSKIDLANRYQLVRAAAAVVLLFGANRVADIKDLLIKSKFEY